MVLKSSILKNFRAYKDIEVNFDKNMNVIIGQNDIGKSTILEALDIFFGQEVIKIDITDWNKDRQENFITIGVEFKVDKDLKVIVDATNPTNLKNEYLLNKDGNLEILKLFNISNNKLSKEKVYLNSFYPECFEIPLINLKIQNLKEKLSEIKEHITDYDSINKTKSADIRQALYQYYVNNNINFANIKIELEKDDAKKVWTSLQNELPLYFLFQSDRTNKDSDGNIQNPLKSATKKIVSEFENDLNKIIYNLEEKLEQIGLNTIEKMKDMGLEIANTLTPKVNHKKLDTLFSFSLESDDGIPLNKRGSGFRRMVMLNYFRAEADKKIKEDKEKNRRDKERGIIYAIEEPETSQHPNHQIMLINALINLSNQENYQIIITTHTPEVAKMVNEENLILINRDNNKNPIIINDEKKMKLIAKTLGIHPFYKNKVVICVEGENDIKFLKGINQAIDEYKSLIDLEKEDIDLIPLHGGNLKNWVDRHYLKNSNVIEVHIYDRDSNSGKNTKQYEKECKKINNRNDNSICLMTEKREMENYIHKSLIESEFGISLDGIKNYDEEDIPTYIKNKIVKPLKESDIKNILNGKLSKKLTKKHLEELEAFDEIKGWFEKIRELKEY